MSDEGLKRGSHIHVRQGRSGSAATAGQAVETEGAGFGAPEAVLTRWCRVELGIPLGSTVWWAGVPA